MKIQKLLPREWMTVYKAGKEKISFHDTIDPRCFELFNVNVWYVLSNIQKGVIVYSLLFKIAENLCTGL